MYGTEDYLLTAYHNLFHCHINYGLTLWGPAPCTTKVLLLQKAAVGLLTASGYLDQTLNWPL